MSTEEALNKCQSLFPQGILHAAVFHGQTSVECSKEALKNILSFFKQEGYEVLMDLTAVDYIEPLTRTKVVYWLHNPANYERVRLSVFANRDETLPSVTHLWEGADWYEREVFDLFGVNFEGHPGMKRILMPEDWVGHPLRRDYALTEVPVEFKHGVKPKIPSEIIPHVKSARPS